MEAIKLLFRHKAKLQHCDGPILFWPITNGTYKIVKILLENGASATAWSKNELGTNYNMTPIQEAARKGHERIADLLVGFGATKLSNRDAVQIRFVEAAQWEDVEVLEKLVERGAQVNVRNPNNETALINLLGAFFKPRPELWLKFVYLLDVLGADVNLKGRGSLMTHGTTTPLHQAIISTKFCFDSKHTKSFSQVEKDLAEQLLRRLIERGAYVSGRDEDEKTPLHVAARWNNVVGAKILIEAGARITPRDSDGKTPLDYAESAEMIRLLKSHGAKEQ
ncbi:MAG: ankyrin repeat domain-containing protein [Phycisphaerales bacterium]|nr:MAG: ankyrin repeat domain-containing protein [Phycisphaerales bacterium]